MVVVVTLVGGHGSGVGTDGDSSCGEWLFWWRRSVIVVTIVVVAAAGRRLEIENGFFYTPEVFKAKYHNEPQQEDLVKLSSVDDMVGIDSPEDCLGVWRDADNIPNPRGTIKLTGFLSKSVGKRTKLADTKVQLTAAI